MKLDQKNSKKQGDVGLGAAIAWFTEQGHTVSIPLTDSQDYDLLVDDGSKLSRVQVKTTSYKRNDNYQVYLTIKGGNRSGIGKAKKFDPTKVDALFVVTENDGNYYIPAESLGGHTNISLCEKYKDFRK